jgi:hypothetical protein
MFLLLTQVRRYDEAEKNVRNFLIRDESSKLLRVYVRISDILAIANEFSRKELLAIIYTTINCYKQYNKLIN